MVLTLDTTIGAGGFIIAEANAQFATTASFSTAANVRLVALCSCNGDTSTTAVVTTSGGGITWTREVQQVTREGAAEIWMAYSSGALSSQTATLTITPSSANDGCSMTVVAVLGAESTHGGAEGTASSASGTPSCAITSTRAGSYIFSCFSDWAAVSPIAPSGAAPAQTELNEHFISTQYSGGQSRSTSTVSVGTQTMAWTGAARNYNMSVAEIRESTGAATNAIQTVGGRGMIQAIYPTATG